MRHNADMSRWRPDLLSLRLFVTVCEEQSITRAAECEDMVPSAVSKRIAEIEATTGVALLVRSARGVRPTPAGLSFLNHARQIVRSTERLQAEVAEYSQGVRGHVRLLANISSIVAFVPRDLNSFLLANPAIRVDLQERSSGPIIDSIRDGSADIGICQAVGELADLDMHPYTIDHLVVVTHPAHPLATRSSLCFEDTLDYEFVALSPNSRTTRLLSGLAARMGRSLNHRVYVNAFEAACHVIGENLAIGILAADAVRGHAAMLGLRMIPLLEDWSRREIVVCTRPRDTLPAPARALVDHLQLRATERGLGERQAQR